MPEIQYTLNLSTNKKITKDVQDVIKCLKEDVYPEVYELIPNEGFIAPYFDVDCKRDHPNFNEWYNNRETLLEDIKTKLCGIFGNDCEFAISDACQDDIKLSYHLKITNRRTTMKDMYAVSRTFEAPLDKAVYHSRGATFPRKFRSVWSVKGNSDRILAPITHENDLQQHFITVIDDQAPIYSFKNHKKEIKNKPPITESHIQSGIGNELRQGDNIGYDDWFKIGISLKCVLGEDKGRIEFHQYSKRHSTYDENQFNLTWENICRYNYTNGGWGFLKKFLDKDLWERYIPSNPPMEMTDVTLADYFLNNFTAYKIRYVPNGKSWFKFERHRWEDTERECVSRDVSNFLSTAYRTLESVCKDDDARSKINKMCQKVENASFRKGVVDTIKEKVCDPLFKLQLNQNRDLLGFNNGVFDLSKGEFRDGNEYDFISFSTGYDYDENPDPIKIAKLEKILLQICCEDPELFTLLMKAMARSMCGDNTTGSSNQKLYCLLGKYAGNGKSTIFTLLAKLLGDYYHSINSTFITQKCARTDGANADLDTLRGRRVLTMSETEKGCKYNASTIKNFSGEDTFSYRGMYKEQQKTSKITFTMFLATNDKMELECDDHGINRRLIYFPMNAKFVDAKDVIDEDDNGVKYYVRDDTFGGTEHQYANEFFHLLLKYYKHKEVIDFGKLISETKKLIDSTDELMEMLSNTFKHTDKNVGISWNDLKGTLQERYGTEWYAIKKRFKPDNNLFDKVADRIRYAKKKGVPCGKNISYIDSEGTKKEANRLFLNIEERELDNEAVNGGMDCVF
jgi:P4 family phage/plasmid primase-like protien